MAAASPSRHAASACIFDLDGLILDTEMMCADVAASVLRAHGAALTPEASKAAMGKRPLDCWRDVVAVLKLQVRRPAE
jgi:beta-phosphoglucomutase-like phosphatase (HAD superfamily)